MADFMMTKPRYRESDLLHTYALSEEDRQNVFPATSARGGGVCGGVKALAAKIKSGEVKQIVVMAGAGISVAAGIPDFRSKGGLYESIKKEYHMDRPECVFDINYFRDVSPIPFTLN